MKCANDIVEFLITICNIIFIYLTFNYYGYLYCILSFISIKLIFYFYLVKIIGLIPLKTNDKLLLSDDFFKRQVIMTQLNITRFCPNQLYEELKERAFKKIEKLSYSLSYEYYNFYWKKKSTNINELCNQRIKILEPMNENELKIFIKKELNDYFDIFNSPIMFYIIPKKESELKMVNSEEVFTSYSEGYLIMKSDHSLTDGLGLLSLIFTLSDNYKPTNMPKIMHQRKEMFYETFFYFLCFIPLCIPLILYLIFTIKSTCRLSNLARTNEVEIGEYKQYDISEIKHHSKKLKMSINEFLIFIVTKAVKNVFKESEKITCIIPFGMSPVPNNISEVKLENHVFALFYKFRLSGNISEFKQDYKNLLRQSFIVKITNFSTNLIYAILPFNWAKAVSSGVMTEVDLGISNVPGQSETIIIKSNIVDTVIPYVTTGNISTCLTNVSYNNKLVVSLNYDGGQKDNKSKEILENFDLILSKYLEKHL